MLSLLDNPAANPNVQRMTSSISIGALVQVVEAALPALRTNRAIAGRVVADLEAMSLLSGADLHATMTAQGMTARRSTPLGQLFLRFISDPYS